MPPLAVDDVLRASTVLYVARIIDKATYRLVWRYIARAGRRFDGHARKSEMSHPQYFAMMHLYDEGRRHNDAGIHAVQLVAMLTQRAAVPPRFSGVMYYRHFLSFRDTCRLYWRFSDETVSHDLSGLKDGLHRFVQHFLARSDLSVTNRKKFHHTDLILSGALLFGGVKPKGTSSHERIRPIGGEIVLSPAHLVSETRPIRLMSARASEEIADDTGVTFGVTYPHQSTRCDQHRINRGIRSGFARTNVCTIADMSACSLSTQRAFLLHTERTADEASFALTWFVAFMGLNFHRPIVERSPEHHNPSDDEILVCAEHNAVVYNILRRRRVKVSEVTFETCGRAFFPVGERIAAGLLEIARSLNQESIVAALRRKARTFAEVRAGQTPTLARLRAGSRTHMKRLGLCALDRAALRGRVPPALLAISAYYPATVKGVFKNFERAYSRAVSAWCLPDAFRLEFGRLPPAHDGPIFRKSSRGRRFAAELLHAIGTLYVKRASALRMERCALHVDRLMDALSSHELGCYALQEMGVGLRPIGKVGDASITGARYGALVADKGSRHFSERSLSVVSTIHEKMLEVREANLDFARHALSNIAVSLRFDEPKSDLARLFRYDPEKGLLIGNRIRARNFRTLVTELPGILVGDEPYNVLRHVSTQELGARVPRWQSDEHHGHKIIGREPFGAWSTVSVADFGQLARSLESLHAEIVPESLLRPIGQLNG